VSAQTEPELPPLALGGGACAADGAEGPCQPVRLYVDPAFRPERSERPKRVARARHVSARNISLWVAGLLALAGVVASAYTLSPANKPNERTIATIDLPAVSRSQSELPPSNPAPASLDEHPVAQVDETSSMPSDPPPARLQLSARQPQPVRFRHPAPASHQETCGDCPPVDAADLPPPGPVVGQNGN
jgi:hypothetical protein